MQQPPPPWTPPPPPMTPPVNIPNYLVPAILSTICCCLPGGVVAIIYATQVNTKIAAGDIHGAMAASKSAKMWVFIAVGVGLVTTTLSIAIQILAAVARN
jgi:hypothetical protein